MKQTDNKRIELVKKYKNKFNDLIDRLKVLYKTDPKLAEDVLGKLGLPGDAYLYIVLNFKELMEG